MPFDPCREWLGIAALDLTDPHVVLGIARGETDPSVIGAAADERLRTLRGIAPGPFAKAHAALLARVAQARDELLAASAGTARSAAPVRANLPPLRAAAASAPQRAPAMPVVISRPTRPARRRSSGGGLAAVSLLAAVAAAAGAYVLWPRPRVAPRRPAAPARESARAPATRPTAVAGTREPAAGQIRPAGGRPAAELAETAPERADDAVVAAVEPDILGKAMAGDGQAVPPPAGQEPSATAVAVERSLRDAHRALRDRDADAAARALDAAAAAADTDADLASRVERWRLLADYARQLVDHREQALADANRGREYQVGDRTIVIVEIDSRTVAYLEAGRTKRRPRKSLPRDIERAILTQWFATDGRAANHIFIGVDQLLDEHPNLADVRAEWQAALEGEPETTSLLPLLDDPIVVNEGG
jgi:hypothetical protein